MYYTSKEDIKELEIKAGITYKIVHDKGRYLINHNGKEIAESELKSKFIKQ